jgi:hypothetical protein
MLCDRPLHPALSARMLRPWGAVDGVRGPERDAALADVPASFGVREVPVLQSAGVVKGSASDDGDRSPDELTWEIAPKSGLAELVREVRELGLLRLGAPAEAVLVENMWTGRARAMRWDAASWSPVEERGRSLHRALEEVTDDGMALLWDALQPDREDAAYVYRFGRVLAGLQDGDALSPLVGLAVQGAATGAGVPVPGAALLGRLVARLLWHHGDHDAITRRRLAEAVSVADLALCAHHGVLAECPGLWLLARSRTSRQVTARLGRYLP